MDTRHPTDTESVCAVMADALAAETPIEIIGGGSKAGFGGVVEADMVLSTAGLSGIISYQPDELVLTAQAGTKMAEIEAALAEAGQHLAFEPPDYRALLGNEDREPTLGGVIATNLSGPARVRRGAARDHLLGAEFVTGRAECIRTGGQVVKNVTGYDLCKLLAGSFGTLGVMTELSVKTLPAPEKTRTVLIAGLSRDEAIAVMTKALQSSNDVSAAGWLPEDLAMGSSVRHVSRAGTSVAALRIDGPEPSVLTRCEALREMAAMYGDVEELHFHNSRKFWEEIGNVTPFAGGNDRLVWRVSAPPAAMGRLVDEIQDQLDVGYFLDWGGGLMFLSVDAEVEEGGAAAIRDPLTKCGGHATLIRGPESLRRQIAVFQPDTPALVSLKENLRAGFDPVTILNPGRMGSGG